MRRAIYPGSFDPFTLGHLWVAEQGSMLFDELIIVVAKNPQKTCTFPDSVRHEMTLESVRHLPNVSVIGNHYSLTADLAKHYRADFILRGLRSSADFEYERSMSHLNADIQPELRTVFLTPPRHLAEVSSSVVRSLMGFNNWEEIAQRLVPQPVMPWLTGSVYAR